MRFHERQQTIYLIVLRTDNSTSANAVSVDIRENLSASPSRGFQDKLDNRFKRTVALTPVTSFWRMKHMDLRISRKHQARLDFVEGLKVHVAGQLMPSLRQEFENWVGGGAPSDTTPYMDEPPEVEIEEPVEHSFEQIENTFLDIFDQTARDSERMATPI